MTDTTYQMGWKQSPIDDRDYKFSDMEVSKSNTRATVDLSHKLPDDWFYQGRLPSCGANAAAFQIWSVFGRRVARLYAHYYARYLEHNAPPTDNGGIYPRLLFKALQKRGVPQEHVYCALCRTWAIQEAIWIEDYEKPVGDPVLIRRRI